MSDQILISDWASPPGETISSLLKERKLSALELACQIEKTVEAVTSLISGEAPLTEAIALSLSKALGASPRFWMRRECEFRAQVEFLESVDTPEAREWVQSLPIKDMERWGWLPPHEPANRALTISCLQFFRTTTVSAWRKKYESDSELAKFRTSQTFASRLGSTVAWLRKGEIEAENVVCGNFDRSAFRELLPDIRKLTRIGNPARFIPSLQAMCATAGVALIILPSPDGCRASGATKVLNDGKALLMLSFRYLSDDHFWFTFFHEAGHLILHSDCGTFLEGDAHTSEKLEEEANRFSQETLIPPDRAAEMRRLPVKGRDVIRFATRAGIAPGIVVGQMQNEGRFTHRQLNDLKRRYSWE